MKIIHRYTVVVIVECVGCKARREIGAGEIKEGDFPTCERCSMPMVTLKAVTKKERTHAR